MVVCRPRRSELKHVWCRFISPLHLALALSLSGCIAAGQSASGISPIINAQSVEASSSNVRRILIALQEDASFGSASPVTWYDVTVAGFNYIDDQCTTYFDTLFKLDRRREASASALSAFNATTNAILSATDAAKLSMAVVAQAFGLAEKLVDVNARMFLYQLPPAPTLRLVQEMQKAYRSGTALQRSRINTPTDAYHRIQSYLEICLPPTIESRLVKHVSDATARPVADPSSSEVEIVVGTPLSVVEQARLTAISRATDRLQPVAEPEKAPGALNAFESRLTSPQIRAFQGALCVNVDGLWGAATRAALVEFYNGAGDPRPHIAQSGVRSDDLVKLREAMQTSPMCRADGAGGAHNSAFQLGQLVS